MSYYHNSCLNFEITQMTIWFIISRWINTADTFPSNIRIARSTKEKSRKSVKPLLVGDLSAIVVIFLHLVYTISILSVHTEMANFCLRNSFYAVIFSTYVPWDSRDCEWLMTAFRSVRIHTLAKALSPAYLRFGGTAADFLIFRHNTSDLLTQSQNCWIPEDCNGSVMSKNFTDFYMSGLWHMLLFFFVTLWLHKYSDDNCLLFDDFIVNVHPFIIKVESS